MRSDYLKHEYDLIRDFTLSRPSPESLKLDKSQILDLFISNLLDKPS